MVKPMLCLVCMCLISSCAVVFNGSKKVITIQSKTPGASIYVDGKDEGKDSVEVALRRKRNHVVIVTKQDFISDTVKIKRHLQVGYLIADIAVLGVKNIFAVPIDAITGAWYNLDKKEVIVELKEK